MFWDKSFRNAILESGESLKNSDMAITSLKPHFEGYWEEG